MILPDRLAESASVLVKNGRIAVVNEVETVAMSAAASVDCKGLTLFPGFIDAHIHGAIGVDTMQASAQDLQRLAGFLATQGVTAWTPTLVPAPQEEYERSIGAIESLMNERRDDGEASAGARAVGVHYEGPFINTSQCGALRGQYFKSYARPSDLDFLKVPSKPSVKMITLAPEIAGGVALIEELSRRGWVVCIGHTLAGVDILDEAFGAGARHITHFMNAMPPLHHRSPGPVGWGLSRDDVTCDFIADGIHLDPLVLRLLLKTKGSRGLSLISDAIAAAGIGDGAYEIWGETITVKNGRTSNSRGSIAGSVITMLDAVRMMLSLGAGEVEVARLASTNPARVMRIDNDCGSIEEGKQADLVALDDFGIVRLTIIGGEIAFDNRAK